MPTPVSVLLTATLMLLPVPIAAQTVQTVQALPGQTPDADALAAAMRRLAGQPRDLDALIEAGELSLKLGDSTAAAGLFARAEKIDPRSGRVRAGMASVLVASERPGEALRYFQQAEAFGYSGREFAGERGLAYDLVGEQERAQRAYRLVLKAAPDDETVRRYALSLGISGKREAALEQIDTLLRKSDRGAWRARAFILAMNGDVPGAERIVASMAPGLAAGLRPFLVRLPGLGAADRAFAVHFGEVAASPARLADARLAPALVPLAPEPVVATMVAANTVTPPAVVRTRERPARQRDRSRGRGGGGVPVVASSVPAASPTPAPTVASASSVPPPRPQTRAPVVVASTETRAPVPARSAPTRAWRTNRNDLLFGRFGYTRERRPIPATPTPSPTPVPPPVAVVAAPAQPPLSQPVPVATASPPAAVAVAPPQPSVPAVAVPPVLPPHEPAAVPTQIASATPIAPRAEATIPVETSSPAEPSALVKPALPVAEVSVAPKQGEGSILAAIIAGLPVPASELGVVPAAAEETPVDEAKSVETPAASPVDAASGEATVRAAAEKAIAEGRAADERAARARRDAEERRAAAAKKAEEAKALAAAKAADEKALAAKKAAADKKAAAAKEAAEEKALAAKKAADEKKAASANVARVWVQVAGGAHEGDLLKAWAAVKAKAPALAGKQGYSTPLRATNRVVTGPFNDADEAQAFVNTLGKQGVSGFVFTSAVGQKITKLGAK